MSLEVLTMGGGGETASIFVTGLSGSDIVTATKDGKTVKGVWNSSESRFEFMGIKSYGMWTVTATNGEQSVYKNVLVDAAVDYEIVIRYSLYLYDQGDECEEVTGGWVTQALGLQTEYNVPEAPTLTKNATNMVLSRTYGQPYCCGIILPKNKIDFTGYKTINAIVDFGGLASDNNVIFRGYFIKDKLGAVCADGVQWFGFGNNVPAETNKAMSYNISSYDGMFVPYIAMYSFSGSLTIRKIWLE